MPNSHSEQTIQPQLRILLLGANGQLGHALAQTLPALGEVRALTRAQLDLADASTFGPRLRAILSDFLPHIIVNAAAYTAVDQAQTQPELAHQVNAHAVRELAQQAKTINSVLVHYSSDYVFDGSGHTPWVETDAPHPLSVYGQSKWAGEQALQDVGGRVLTLRTSWVVGAHGGNFLKTMLRLAAERDSLRVVADQIGVPTSSAWLAQLTLELLRVMHAVQTHDPRWGTYHAVPTGETSWHGYAVHAITYAQQHGGKLRVQPQAIEAIPTEAYPLPAPRPRNSRLSSRKLCDVFGIVPPPWQQGVEAIIDDILGVQQP